MSTRIFVMACLASLLVACGATKPAIVRTETVEVAVPQYIRLPTYLTKTPAEPAAPPARCRDAKNRQTVCHEDGFQYMDRLRAWGRGMAGQLGEIESLQPEVGEE